MDKSTNYVGQPIFTQVLSLIDPILITQSCKKHQADKFAKKLIFKDHLTTMLYTIFSRCTSIREVQAGLELCHGKLNHLNLEKVPARSTFKRWQCQAQQRGFWFALPKPVREVQAHYLGQPFKDCHSKQALYT